MKYGNITLGQIEAFINKLGGEEVLKGILAGTIEITTKITTKVKNLFTKLTSTVVAAVGKATSNCFTGPIWKYRDEKFDTWLPKNQPKRNDYLVTVVRPEMPWTFIEFAQAVLGVTTSDVKELGAMLIKGGHTLTLTQAEDLAERTEAGEATCLATNGYGNFYFVETGNEDVPVAVGDVRRDDSHNWDANVYHLVYVRSWNVAYRFLLCNADTSKL